MRNIRLIVKREYVERVRTKSFIIFTLLFPILMFCISVVPSMLVMKKSGGMRRVVLVADNKDFASQAKDSLAAAGKGLGFDYHVEIDNETSPAERARLNQEIDSKQIDGYIWATNAAIQSGKIGYTANHTNDFIEIEEIRSSLKESLMKQRLSARGLSQADIENVLKPVEMEAVEYQHGKTKTSNEMASMLSTIMLVVMLYVTVLMYGIAVMRSVLEEKTSRVMEVMLSAVTAKELMAGKIIGVGAVGITQIMLWALLGVIIAGPGALLLGSTIALHISISFSSGLYFAVFFLLGYLLYSAMCAALGAIVNSEQEAQQMQTVVILPLILSITLMMFVIRQPNAPLSVWLSLVPFCTPVLMYLRVIQGAAPAWQIAASIALMLATTYGMLLLCSRIYRVGILMHGKRPTLPEIMKWIKYA